jgi:uncharacterized OB-fold protein
MFMIEGAECECGKKVVSKRKICPECKKPMMDGEFQNVGKILTYTTLHSPPEGFEGPIRLCMVELEGAAHLLCSFEDEKDLDIGMQVRVKKENDLYFCESME